MAQNLAGLRARSCITMESVGWATIRHEIDNFGGVEKIHNLSALPIENHPNEDSLRTVFINRGRVFLELQSPCLRNFDGAAIKEEKLMSGKKERVLFKTSSNLEQSLRYSYPGKRQGYAGLHRLSSIESGFNTFETTNPQKC